MKFEKWITFRQSNVKDLESDLDLSFKDIIQFEHGALSPIFQKKIADAICQKYGLNFEDYFSEIVVIPPLNVQDVKTGSPVQFYYHRNLVKSPNLGERMGQHIEPHGEYLSYHEPGSLFLDNYEYGIISFSNPLVIQWESDNSPMNHNNKNWGWKSELSSLYGEKGKRLSEVISGLGYDGIITLGAFGPGSVGEIVNLNGIKKS